MINRGVRTLPRWKETTTILKHNRFASLSTDLDCLDQNKWSLGLKNLFSWDPCFRRSLKLWVILLQLDLLNNKKHFVQIHSCFFIPTFLPADINKAETCSLFAYMCAFVSQYDDCVRVCLYTQEYAVSLNLPLSSHSEPKYTHTLECCSSLFREAGNLGRFGNRMMLKVLCVITVCLG